MPPLAAATPSAIRLDTTAAMDNAAAAAALMLQVTKSCRQPLRWFSLPLRHYIAAATLTYHLFSCFAAAFFFHNIFRHAAAASRQLGYYAATASRLFRQTADDERHAIHYATASRR